MASEQANAPLPQQQQATHAPAPVLPNYPELILNAIEALNDRNGSNKSAISKQIEQTLNDVPAAHTTLLTHHLNRMKQSGQLIMVKNNYMKPDPNAQPKRGRGRPPKPKAPLPPGTVLPPPRPRGRPPKPRDPNAPPPPPPKPKAASGTGRGRGRPPKKAKTAATGSSSSSVSAPVASGVKRGRGRPPKAKPAVEAVAG